VASNPKDLERLVAQFRTFLLRAADREAADTVPARVDLVTLLTELAALNNEVRLEARHIKGALDEFRSLATTQDGANRRMGEALEQTRLRADAAARDAERALLLEILELRDRLEAALSSIRAHRPLPIERFTGGGERFVRSLGEGMEITMRRVDEVLARHGVSPLAVEGRALDPHTMHVAEVEHDPEQPDGVVLTELRKGFVRGDELLRAAEVLANRAQRDDGDL